MSLVEAHDLTEAQNILNYLNRCHDGSIKTILFMKKREIDPKTGDLVYDAVNIKEMALCDIKIEMFLNSYEGAKKDQVVMFEFKRVKKFNFFQDVSIDYSDVYESTVANGVNSTLEFKFLSTGKKLPTLSISCEKLVLTEK
mgnify:CR=1 FL=1